MSSSASSRASSVSTNRHLAKSGDIRVTKAQNAGQKNNSLEQYKYHFLVGGILLVGLYITYMFLRKRGEKPDQPSKTLKSPDEAPATQEDGNRTITLNEANSLREQMTNLGQKVDPIYNLITNEKTYTPPSSKKQDVKHIEETNSQTRDETESVDDNADANSVVSDEDAENGDNILDTLRAKPNTEHVANKEDVQSLHSEVTIEEPPQNLLRVQCDVRLKGKGRPRCKKMSLPGKQRCEEHDS